MGTTQTLEQQIEAAGLSQVVANLTAGIFCSSGTQLPASLVTTLSQASAQEVQTSSGSQIVSSGSSGVSVGSVGSTGISTNTTNTNMVNSQMQSILGESSS